jgi:KAP family P-loop domain
MAALHAAVITAAGFFGLSSVVSKFLTNLSFRSLSPNETRNDIEGILSDWMKKNSRDGLDFALALFIDDLDRCSAETMIQVCEAVKLYLDVPGIIIVLGWNLSALDRTAASDDNDSADNVRAYLDKSIQVTVSNR